jgi:uncharacterized protein (TIGR01777 family)
MRIIIAGGSGLIGSVLTRDLRKDNHEVIILTRDPGRVTPMDDSVRLFAWDGKTQQGWGKLVDGADAVVNLAGANLAGEGFFPARWNKFRKSMILQSRIHAGQAITDAIKSASDKPKVLVQASAIGFYGASNVQRIDESSKGGEDFSAQVCREWEQSTQNVEGMGVRRVIIRTGIVLSPQGGTLTRMLLPIKLFVGGPFGNGRQIMSWIHIADEVKAIRYLIDNPDTMGVYNLTSPNPVPNAEIGRAMARILHRPYYLPIPGFGMRFAFGEVARIVLGSLDVQPNRLLKSGFEFSYPKIEMALANIL